MYKITPHDHTSASSEYLYPNTSGAVIRTSTNSVAPDFRIKRRQPEIDGAYRRILRLGLQHEILRFQIAMYDVHLRKIVHRGDDARHLRRVSPTGAVEAFGMASNSSIPSNLSITRCTCVASSYAPMSSTTLSSSRGDA